MPKTIFTYVSPRTCDQQAQRLCQQLPIMVKPVDSLERLFRCLCDPQYQTNFVAISMDTFTVTPGLDMFDVISTLHTLIRSRSSMPDSMMHDSHKDIRIMVIVDETSDPDLVRQAMSSPYIASVGWIVKRPMDLAASAEHLLRVISGDHAHDPRAVDLVKPQRKKKPVDQQVSLTPRQGQIFRLVRERGCSNKIIGRILGITESTVKLHMSAIMKKFGVKNRTQLAVFEHRM